MTLPQFAWLALIIVQVAVLVLAFAFNNFQQRRTQVAVLPQFQAPLAELTDALVEVTASANALKTTAANAPSAQDLADTAAAVQVQADAAKALAASIAPSNVTLPVIE